MFSPRRAGRTCSETYAKPTGGLPLLAASPRKDQINKENTSTLIISSSLVTNPPGVTPCFKVTSEDFPFKASKISCYTLRRLLIPLRKETCLHRSHTQLELYVPSNIRISFGYERLPAVRRSSNSLRLILPSLFAIQPHISMPCAPLLRVLLTRLRQSNLL